MVLPTDVWDVTGWPCGTHYQEMPFGFTWGYSVLVKLGVPYAGCFMLVGRDGSEPFCPRGGTG